MRSNGSKVKGLTWFESYNKKSSPFVIGLKSCVGWGYRRLDPMRMAIRKRKLDLTLPPTQPISLTRGPRSHLVTLLDAAILIGDVGPFRQARPVWDRAAEMILLAGTTREPGDVQEATRRLLVTVVPASSQQSARSSAG